MVNETDSKGFLTEMVSRCNGSDCDGCECKELCWEDHQVCEIVCEAAYAHGVTKRTNRVGERTIWSIK